MTCRIFFWLLRFFRDKIKTVCPDLYINSKTAYIRISLHLLFHLATAPPHFFSTFSSTFRIVFDLLKFFLNASYFALSFYDTLGKILLIASAKCLGSTLSTLFLS